MKFGSRSNVVSLLFAVLFESHGLGQAAILEIEVEGASYVMESTDSSKIARCTQPIPPTPPPPSFLSYVSTLDGKIRHSAIFYKNDSSSKKIVAITKI